MVLEGVGGLAFVCVVLGVVFVDSTECIVVQATDIGCVGSFTALVWYIIMCYD